MYHSVTFITPGGSTLNSYSNFHMVPDGRPIIAMPSPVTTIVEVPGAISDLDLSESLTGYPTYSNRTGELSFTVLNDYEGPSPETRWARRYHSLANLIHGRRLGLILEDDPTYYYEGRFTLNSWETPNSKGFSKVSIGYNLDPYKYWMSNPNVTTIELNGDRVLRYSYSDLNLGLMPVVPTFKISNISTMITIELVNDELYSNMLSHTVSSNGTYHFGDLVLTDISKSNHNLLQFSGRGTIEVSINNGDL